MTLWRWNRTAGRWEATPFCAPDALDLTRDVRLVGVAPRRAALLTRSGTETTVNGESVLPIHVLGDRDEIAVPGGPPAYVTADGPVDLVPFPAAHREMRCGRCKGGIEAGAPSVRCPRCGAWHHQTEALPCWTYDRSCSACSRATAGFAWEPEPLVEKERGGAHAG